MLNRPLSIHLFLWLPHCVRPLLPCLASGWHRGGLMIILGWRKASSMRTGFVGKIKSLNLFRPEFCDKRFLPTFWNYRSMIQILINPATSTRHMPPSEMNNKENRFFLMSIIKSYKNDMFRVGSDPPTSLLFFLSYQLKPDQLLEVFSPKGKTKIVLQFFFHAS